MSQSDNALIERSGQLLTIILNRPEQANAINQEMVDAILQAFDNADGVRAATIRAEGRNFCAGFDLSDIESLSDGDLLWRFLRIETMLQAVHHAPFPVMAQAHGHVVGAGADLFAACWQRIASPDARFQMPGWNFELALGTRRLTALIGADAARDMLIDTRRLDAQQALEIGLASSVSPVDDWPAVTEKFVERSQSLPADAVTSMLALTRTDTRDADLAAIVQTAGRPGLKERISQYRTRVAASRAARPR